MPSGDMYQLPPVKDQYIYSHTKLDERPQCAPSHWDENFQIYYLTEKMRSKGDDKFGEVCDRVGRGTITSSDELFLKYLFASVQMKIQMICSKKERFL